MTNAQPRISDMERAMRSVDKSLASFLESQISLWDSYVDPRDAFQGEDGEIWNGIGGNAYSPIDELPFRNCVELFHIQSIARRLWRDNEFAINGHTNRINYIVGKTHTYTVVGISNAVAGEKIARVQMVLDDILKVNRWKNRQKEIKLRDDRDGETFIRKFRCDDGLLRFRFVEPRSIEPPDNAADHQSFGIETEPHDIESVLAYFVDGHAVDASEIQHRKQNVDSSNKRGLPLFFSRSQKPGAGGEIATEYVDGNRDSNSHCTDS